MNYVVTNQEKFSKVKHLDLSGTLNKGNVAIVTTDGQEIEQDGQFGPHDFEEEWGFVLTSS